MQVWKQGLGCDKGRHLHTWQKVKTVSERETKAPRSRHVFQRRSTEMKLGSQPEARAASTPTTQPAILQDVKCYLNVMHY